MVIIHARPSLQTLLVFLAIIIIATAAHTINGTDQMVYVTNDLNLTLIVHCRSKNDDLKAHCVPTGSNISWSFEYAYILTLFWCKLAMQDKCIHFDAYDGKNDYI
ncbi:hypothetical protein LINPERHAP1_LOCUS14784 [Linum perenne]